MGLCTNHVDKLGGGGVAQMSTLINKSYLVKVSTKGRGQKCPKFCLLGLYTAPYDMKNCREGKIRDTLWYAMRPKHAPSAISDFGHF